MACLFYFLARAQNFGTDTWVGGEEAAERFPDSPNFVRWVGEGPGLRGEPGGSPVI